MFFKSYANNVNWVCNKKYEIIRIPASFIRKKTNTSEYSIFICNDFKWPLRFLAKNKSYQKVLLNIKELLD